MEVKKDIDISKITWRTFENEEDLANVMRMMTRDLSEPYPIYTYRYFVQQWPHLCLFAYIDDALVGCIVSKLDEHKKKTTKPGTKGRNRGYIAMLSVEPEFRKIGIGRLLIKKSIDIMINDGADEIMLETEVCNLSALRLYESFGFIRDKRLSAYYLNGNDAYKLKLLIN